MNLLKDIPQYISEGSKEILLAKYELIKKGHELSLIGSTTSDDENQNRQGKIVDNIIALDEKKIEYINAFRTWKRPKLHAKPETITLGDICITPFFNCHSIYDSYMFLIEADGQRIWHMGDYREHGYMGKGLFPTLNLWEGFVIPLGLDNPIGWRQPYYKAKRTTTENKLSL